MPDHAAGVEDDAGALRHHGVGHRLRAVEDAAQVDVDDGVELLQRHLLQPCVLRDAGVVDQHVDAAATGFLHGRHHGVDRVALRHVHTMPEGTRAQCAALRDGGLDGVAAHVAHVNDSALACELQGGGQADALGGAGDEGDLVLESHGFSCRKPQ
jgi:hypothetical protein